MALLNIPISNTRTHYEFSTILDGVEYYMEFRYNTRAAYWVLSISDGQKNPIYTGLPIFVNQDILQQVRAYSLPQGLLAAVNNASIGIEPDRDNFSTDVVLLYNEV